MNEKYLFQDTCQYPDLKKFVHDHFSFETLFGNIFNYLSEFLKDRTIYDSKHDVAEISKKIQKTKLQNF